MKLISNEEYNVLQAAKRKEAETDRKAKEVMEQLDAKKKELAALEADIKDKISKIDKVDELTTKIAELKQQAAEAEFKKGLEIQELEALIKIKEQKTALELAQKEVELEKKFIEQDKQRTAEYLVKILTKQDEVAKDTKETSKIILDTFAKAFASQPTIARGEK